MRFMAIHTHARLVLISTARFPSARGMEKYSLIPLVLALLYHCQGCSGEADNMTMPSCNTTGCDGSSGSSPGEHLRKALAASGGSAALGLGSVLVLVAVVFICKARSRRRRSYSPESGAQVTRKATRKKSIKPPQNGTNADSTHNYETVLPNFKTKPPVNATAQNYEVPMVKSATLPLAFTATDSGHCKTQPPHTTKFSQSVKVRGSTPEPVYMNAEKAVGGGKDVCAINPWALQHHLVNSHTPGGVGRGGVEEQVAESETSLVSASDPWAT